MHPSPAWLPLLVATLVSAGRNTGRPNHGLIGYGIEMYNPVCAYSCEYCFNGGPLLCNDAASMGSGMAMRLRRDDSASTANMTMISRSPSAVCLSESVPYLTSTAWCIQAMCPDGTPVWQIEKWWDTYVAGNQLLQPKPSLSYGAALALIAEPPTTTASGDVNITKTMLANMALYTALYVSIDTNQDVEIEHERVALVVFLSGICIPVGFSFLRFFPFPPRWVSWFHGRFVYPLLLRPWRHSLVSTVVGEPPTVGQALFVGYLIIINTLLSCWTYEYNPLGWNYWWNNGPDEIMGSLANRLGVLAFANFALLVLYSSRNNLLLWLTDWDFSTFVLLHRWVARIAILQTILHSLVFLRDWIVNDRLVADQVKPYWYYGCIGTIAASLLIPLSLHFVRLHQYEVFLASHIIFSILVLVGSWYHIIYCYEHQWGYETWLYVVFAIWGFDRLIRLLRTLRHGLRTAIITQIDDDYVRLEVRGVVAPGHVYLYFLNWRVWENHPFSVASSVIHLSSDSDADVASTETFPSAAPTKEESSPNMDPEATGGKTPPTITHQSTSDHHQQNLAAGMVFYVRLHAGGTRALRHKTTIPLLIEGPYGRREDLSAFPHLLAIAGGVGVTAILPYLRAHEGRKSLHWSSRSQALVDALRPLVVATEGRVETVVGQRLDLRGILDGGGDDLAVVVSGPQGMMDEVRGIVAGLSGSRNVRFVAESFTW